MSATAEKKPKRSANYKKKIQSDLDAATIAAEKDRLVDLDSEIILIESKKAAATADFNGKLKDKRAERVTLLDAIKSGKAEVELEVFDEEDERRGVMVTYRADNHEQVAERPLTAEERQGNLPGIGVSDDEEGGESESDDGSDGAPVGVEETDGEPTGETTPDGGKVVNFPPGKRAKKGKK